MDLADIRKKAEDLGINPDTLQKMTKTEAIRAIQSAEGNTACFGTKTDGCPHMLCCFMVDCYTEGKRKAKPAAPKARKTK
jgi:hypothetical protein